MRLLGSIFLVVLVLAVVGHFRGWFTITTATHASGRSDVTVNFDKDRLGDDSRAIATQLGKLSAQAAQRVKALGRPAGPDQSQLDGWITAIDPSARVIVVVAGSEPIELSVPNSVPITQQGETLSFGQLRVATRLRCTFQHIDDDRKLSHVEILR